MVHTLNRLNKRDLRLCLCTAPVLSRDRSVGEVVEAAVSGGVTMVQVREKTASTREFYHRAVEIREITQRLRVPLIINDRPAIALAIGADGVHLGQSDMPVEAARRLMGNGIIGVSAGTVEQAVLAWKGGADYIGVGAVFPTSSKDDSGEAIGLERLREICTAVEIPVIAIGGICVENAAAVMRCGASGIAVISAIFARTEIRDAAQELLSAVTSAITPQ
jgi:thiamine-phosphate pyrophosphorylase